MVASYPDTATMAIRGCTDNIVKKIDPVKRTEQHTLMAVAQCPALSRGRFLCRGVSNAFELQEAAAVTEEAQENRSQDNFQISGRCPQGDYYRDKRINIRSKLHHFYILQGDKAARLLIKRSKWTLPIQVKYRPRSRDLGSVDGRCLYKYRIYMGQGCYTIISGPTGRRGNV